MKNFLAIGCLLLVAVTVQSTPFKQELTPLSGRIIGGVNAEPHQYPFICSVQLDQGHICGSSILNPNWILTAAHCIFPALIGQMSVVCGKWDVSVVEAGEQRRPINEFFMHEEFGELPATFPWDIALLHVFDAIEFSPTIQPTILPPVNHNAFTRDVTILGWGIYRYENNIGQVPAILQHAEIPLITSEQCLAAVGATWHEHFLCTGPSEGGFGACSGDSGGPMIQETDNGVVQVGVAAWAFLPCGGVNQPSGYVAVHNFIDWIETTIISNP